MDGSGERVYTYTILTRTFFLYSLIRGNAPTTTIAITPMYIHTFHHNTHTPTGDPSPDWAWLHNRFPLVLPSKEAEAQWLDTDKFKAEELLSGLRAPVDIPGMVGRWVGGVLLCWLWWVRDVRPAAWTILLSFCAPTRRDRCATPAPRK